jgi:hypothetical protein
MGNDPSVDLTGEQKGAEDARGDSDDQPGLEGRPEPFPFREGPVPEIFIGETPAELLGLICTNLSLFIDELGYDPENIGILVPRNRDVREVIDALDLSGYLGVDVTTPDFSFQNTGAIRVSTLHSSKGLDIPIVFLYLPYLHRHGQYAEQEEELLLRNLVYVGITRAMDNVHVFTVEKDDPVLQDLVGCFR